jgi:hypothetical protein
MNVTAFSKTFNAKPSRGRVIVTDITVAPTAGLEEMIAAAHAAGASKGARGRQGGGVFELQTDDGIWSSDDGGKLDANHASFATWEELEAAELAA